MKKIIAVIISGFLLFHSLIIAECSAYKKVPWNTSMQYRQIIQYGKIAEPDDLHNVSVKFCEEFTGRKVSETNSFHSRPDILTAVSDTLKYLETNALACSQNYVTFSQLKSFIDYYAGLVSVAIPEPQLKLSGNLTYEDTGEILSSVFGRTGFEYALENGYILPFPKDWNNIDADYFVHRCELHDIAINFVRRYAESISKNISLISSYEVDMIFRNIYNYLRFFRIFVPQDKSNEKNYNWYFTQLDTGSESNMNCMPAMACMALKWRDENFSLTPESLRNLYGIKGGWYPSQLRNCLEDFGADYETHSAIQENIISDLNNGNIILTQISTADPENYGHCMVIYGYRKVNSEYNFLIYDPLIISPDNEPLIISIPYAMHIIRRFTSEYITISAQGNYY